MNNLVSNNLWFCIAGAFSGINNFSADEGETNGRPKLVLDFLMGCNAVNITITQTTGLISGAEDANIAVWVTVSDRHTSKMSNVISYTSIPNAGKNFLEVDQAYISEIINFSKLVVSLIENAKKATDIKGNR